MSWRMKYGIEVLDAIDREPGRLPSHYINQFENMRTAHLRIMDMVEDGLIATHEIPDSYNRRTLTLTDKGRTVLDLCKKIERVMEADR